MVTADGCGRILSPGKTRRFAVYLPETDSHWVGLSIREFKQTTVIAVLNI